MKNIGGYNFDIGYALYNTQFNEVAGIYLIYTNFLWLDVGQTDKLSSRLQSHERKTNWIKNSGQNLIYVAFHQEPNLAIRLLKETQLRAHLNPICGNR